MITPFRWSRGADLRGVASGRAQGLSSGGVLIMIRWTGGGTPCSLGIAAGAVVALGVGGLSLAVASSEGRVEGARVEQARGDEARELEEARRAAEAARVEIERLDRVRANQFQELVGLRREANSLRKELEVAVTARSEADVAEIAHLDRVRQNLFEDLVGTRRELASAQARLQAGASAPHQVELSRTGSLARQSPEMSAQRPPLQTSAAISPPRDRPADMTLQRAPVRALPSAALVRSSMKAMLQKTEKAVPAKPNAVRADARRSPQALPSTLMLRSAP